MTSETTVNVLNENEITSPIENLENNQDNNQESINNDNLLLNHSLFDSSSGVFSSFIELDKSSSTNTKPQNFIDCLNNEGPTSFKKLTPATGLLLLYLLQTNHILDISTKKSETHTFVVTYQEILNTLKESKHWSEVKFHQLAEMIRGHNPQNKQLLGRYQLPINETDTELLTTQLEFAHEKQIPVEIKIIQDQYFISLPPGNFSELGGDTVRAEFFETIVKIALEKCFSQNSSTTNNIQDKINNIYEQNTYICVPIGLRGTMDMCVQKCALFFSYISTAASQYVASFSPNIGHMSILFKKAGKTQLELLNPREFLQDQTDNTLCATISIIVAFLLKKLVHAKPQFSTEEMETYITRSAALKTIFGNFKQNCLEWDEKTTTQRLSKNGPWETLIADIIQFNQEMLNKVQSDANHSSISPKI